MLTGKQGYDSIIAMKIPLLRSLMLVSCTCAAALTVGCYGSRVMVTEDQPASRSRVDVREPSDSVDVSGQDLRRLPKDVYQHDALGVLILDDNPLGEFPASILDM